MNGAAAIALAGAVVGAVLAFSLGQIDARLSRRRRGRTAARLIWYELMAARATVRHLKNVGTWVGDRRFPTQAWESERSAFTEVADGYAFAVVSLAYAEMANLQWTYEMLARIKEVNSGLTGAEALGAEIIGLQVPSSLPAPCFAAIEKALVQLDRFSGLAKRPVNYAELDKQSGLSR